MKVVAEVARKSYSAFRHERPEEQQVNCLGEYNGFYCRFLG